MIPVKQLLRDLYLEYYDDYLSAEVMGSDYKIDKEILLTLLEIGAMFSEELVIKNDK